MEGVRLGVAVGAPIGVLVGWLLLTVNEPVWLVAMVDVPVLLRASTLQ